MALRDCALLALVNEELVLAGVEHALSDVPVEEGVGVVPLHGEQLLPQVELADLRRSRQAPAADVSYDVRQGTGSQVLDVAGQVEAGAVQELRLLLRQRTPARRKRSSFVSRRLCQRVKPQLVCIPAFPFRDPGKALARHQHNTGCSSLCQSEDQIVIVCPYKFT